MPVVSPISGHATPSGCGLVGPWPARLLGTLEVDADPCAQCVRCLRHRVDPLVLAATAHHHQVAGRRMERDTGTTGARLEEETARGPEREDGHDALWPPAGEPVAMPAGAVLAAAVEIEPDIVVAHPVVPRQRVTGGNQRWVGRVGEPAVLRRQPGLEEPLTEE